MSYYPAHDGLRCEECKAQVHIFKLEAVGADSRYFEGCLPCNRLGHECGLVIEEATGKGVFVYLGLEELELRENYRERCRKHADSEEDYCEEADHEWKPMSRGRKGEECDICGLIRGRE